MPIPPNTRIPAHKTLRETVKEQIRDAIMDGTFAPGERLQDADLMEWLRTSRTPIREAINELALAGLIELSARRYTRVPLIESAEVAAYSRAFSTLLAGIARVTLPTLSPAATDDIVVVIARIRSAIADRDCAALGAHMRTLVGSMLDLCPNAVLVRATADTLDACLFRITHSAGVERDWDLLGSRFAALEEAVALGEPALIERAVDRLCAT